jgi:formate dehydrogenase assembly factor FdhD
MLTDAEIKEIEALRGDLGAWKSRAEINGRKAFELMDQLTKAEAVIEHHASSHYCHVCGAGDPGKLARAYLDSDSLPLIND